jgi:phosphotransferase system IIB component
MAGGGKASTGEWTMVSASKLQTAYQSSMQILEQVMQAQNDLQAVFGNGVVSRRGIIRDVNQCNAALGDAIAHLLDAQRRLNETPWPVDDDYDVVEAAD